MATSYLSPGVYVEEVERGSRPIEAVGTSTAAFLGESAQGPVNEPVLVTNWSQFTRVFGGFTQAPVLAHAVYGFFANGGTRLFVCNVGQPTPSRSDQRGASREGAANDAQGKKGSEAKGNETKGLETSPDASTETRPPSALAPTDVASIAAYVGRDEGPGRRSGVHAFDDIAEISLVAAPGQTDPAVQDALLSHCERLKHRFAILDAPEDFGSDGIAKMPRPRDSNWGAYYFPWIQVVDPDRGPVWMPPSGHLAGLYARSDAERGIHKAPANEIVRGALALRHNLSRAEQDFLNPRGINCIRHLGDRGIRVWGARTISSDPAWRYVNVRRLLLMVEQSIEVGTQWVVFEPNDETLWKKVRRNVSAFLLRVHATGALAGRTPEEAFYVKCDAETNPPEVVDAGQMVCEVGIAPVKPAEFVIFRIGQMAGAE